MKKLKLKTKYKLKIIIVIGYMIFIYFFSEFKFPDPSSGDPSLPKISILPFLHMGEFGLLSMLLMYAFYDKINTYILLAVSVLYGIFDEIHQYFVPYRWFDYEDIICDVIGSFLGILGFFILLIVYTFIFLQIKRK